MTQSIFNHQFLIIIITQSILIKPWNIGFVHEWKNAYSSQVKTSKSSLKTRWSYQILALMFVLLMEVICSITHHKIENLLKDYL